MLFDAQKKWKLVYNANMVQIVRLKSGAFLSERFKTSPVFAVFFLIRFRAFEGLVHFNTQTNWPVSYYHGWTGATSDKRPMKGNSFYLKVFLRISLYSVLVAVQSRENDIGLFTTVVTTRTVSCPVTPPRTGNWSFRSKCKRLFRSGV